ncbi:TonB-dependent receptor plug domain-containing protein [Chryseolinea sp. H1M3-3]|uniref:TonB-dependent receptor plug domain-containing protein n=1 Tax=Chryseolinea sp. H1M3-3 TaxID=3034144 RepID=UPI0023EDA838|nr:TonB-dependent receptor plug domain-containing protein [Chryseolinea sp. H1M3-3]
MNVTIVSASKKAETLFNAPLSASVLTKEEISLSGATSIMEALRLIPGLIVRQLTNGNYDIHIRGLDNVPPNSLRLSSTNTTALVMIDNRPVYNYLQGGIIWESLPIDLNDIQKIEVIRGPSSTLYGPNAVSGVINIITNKVEKYGLHTQVETQIGTLRTSVINGAVGYRFNKKLTAIMSANFQSRGREIVYQDLQKQRWFNTIDSLSTLDPLQVYPHPDRSLIKHGANAFINYTPTSKVELNLSAGLQKSEAQTCTFDSFVSNINTFTSTSQYVDIRAAISRLTTQFSFNTGNQQTVLGFKTSFDYYNTDLSFEYEFKIKRLSIKPAIAYRSAIYDDTKRGDASKREGTINGRRHMETYGATLRGEYSFWKESVRLTGGIRADQFTYPGDLYWSYQAASSISANKNNLFRIVYSKAFRSPFIYDTYQDLFLTLPLGTEPETYMLNNMLGNKNLNLLSSTMFEVGYRGKVSEKITLDIEGYSTKTKNFSANIIDTPTSVIPDNYPFLLIYDSHTLNTPLSVRQMGITTSIHIQLKKLTIKPFVTIQKTTLHDYTHFTNTSDASPSPLNNFDPLNNNIYSGMGTEMDHKFTPKAYGGIYVNYQFSKFNVNVNGYYFSKHTFYHISNLFTTDGSGQGEVESKAIINAKISFTPIKALSLFVNAKNILNKQSREYYLSDMTPAMIFGGLSFKM